MGEKEVQEFLTFLASERKVSASTQNQALSALIFLYRNVLHKELDLRTRQVTAKLSTHLPTVLTPTEVRNILQDVFPASQRSTDPESGVVRRSHLHPSAVQKSVRRAARSAGLDKRVTLHTFWHSFATHLLEAGYDIRTVQELLGHKDVKTTMIYTHVLNRSLKAVGSLLDSTS